MGVHDIFAANLRAHCRRFKSIAEVCRGTGINRQQFNRYLSGQNIPNKRTLSKLSAFLAIDDALLFVQEQESRGFAKPNNSSRYLSLGNALFEDLKAQGARQKHLLDGYYACYFPLQGHEGMLVKCLVLIRRDDQTCHFLRRTVFRSPSSPEIRLAQGRHEGLVLADDRNVYLIGVNKLKPHHLSTVVIDCQHLDGGSILLGLAITKGMATDFASRICLEFLGPKRSHGKRVLPSLGLQALGSANLSPTVSMLMERHSEQQALQLAMPVFEDALVGHSRMPGGKSGATAEDK
jgi:transcriptional regulator with XRE-family HTH domain